MDLHLIGKNAIVTGGSEGIGKSIAMALAKEGCNVSICARTEYELNDPSGKKNDAAGSRESGYHAR